MANKKSKAQRKRQRESTNNTEERPVKGPRLDPQIRILSRFYEPLILLYVLGKTRGEHQPANIPRGSNLDNWSTKHVRRRFLYEAAYLCDYEKGGDTVTAIALEKTPQGRTLWIAANSCPTKKIVPFMTNLLSKLRSINGNHSNPDEITDRITRDCIDFARHRIKAYADFIQTQIRKSKKRLERELLRDQKYLPLCLWLENFQALRDSHVELCRFAFDHRRCEEMKLLETLCKEPSFQPDQNSSHLHFRMLRHYVGRLGHHIKAVRILVLCVPRVLNSFDELEVRGTTSPPRTTAPPADDKTNLSSILKRMLPANSTQLPHYQEALLDMDMKFHIQKRFMDVYCDPNFKPRVHAEVQLLDFFEDKGLKFEDADVFIACSKPACYCCFLYFRYHPQHPVPPATHQNIHRNWRPPDFQDSNNRQRDILNKMIHDIRTESLHQIDQRRLGSSKHPDSTTGITESVMDIFDQPISVYDSDELNFDCDSDVEILALSSSPLEDENMDIISGADPIVHSQLDRNDAAPLSDWGEDSDISGGVPL